MPDGAWAMSLLPTGLILFLGIAWWLDTKIKRSQRDQARNERRGVEEKYGAGQLPLPPKELKPRDPSMRSRDTLKGDHG
jgi:hypothetical protein